MKKSDLIKAIQQHEYLSWNAGGKLCDYQVKITNVRKVEKENMKGYEYTCTAWDQEANKERYPDCFIFEEAVKELVARG